MSARWALRSSTSAAHCGRTLLGHSCGDKSGGTMVARVQGRAGSQPALLLRDVQWPISLFVLYIFYLIAFKKYLI